MARNTQEAKDIDKLIGLRIQKLRTSMGISRDQLARKIGVTHQQLQKYEKGTNRIAASRLVFITRALGKKVSYFLCDLDIKETELTTHQRMSMDVSRNFMCIKNPTTKNAIHLLTKSLVESANA